MNHLTDQLNLYNKANTLYHNSDEPIMTDVEFDVLKQTLLAAGYLKANDVGATPNSGLPTQVHVVPMLSLSNCFTELGLRTFLKMLGPCRVSLDDKLDGMACSLSYRKGKLITGLTRGDGISGENILPNLINLTSVPKELPVPIDLEVRGEIVIDRISFQRLNDQLALEQKPLLKSSRNTTVGSMRAKSPQVAVDRGCQFIAYSWLGSIAETHSAGMNYLKELGFNTVTASPVFHNEQVDEIVQYAQTRLNGETPVDIDGIVIKVEEIERRQLLGENGSVPYWAIAYKENNVIADTLVTDVQWQVGRLGAITPVAHLAPVVLSGATIDRATLHNYDEIERLDLSIGDVVRIVRSGQVIPKITAVVATGNGVHIDKPTHCPVCNRVVAISDQVVIRCNHTLPTVTEPMCPGVAVARLISATAKDTLELKGIGPEMITDLYNAGKIHNVWDLYGPHMPSHLAQRHPSTASVRLPHYESIIASARTTDIYRAVKALGIPFIGNTVSKEIAPYITCLKDLMVMTPAQLGLKGVIAQNLEVYLQHTYIQNMIMHLDNILTYILPTRPSNTLENLNFVVTGSFDATMSRKEIEAYIVSNGGSLQSGVNAKTSFLVAGDSAGSKLAKAKTLGITIHSRDQFLAHCRVLGCK